MSWLHHHLDLIILAVLHEVKICIYFVFTSSLSGPVTLFSSYLSFILRERDILSVNNLSLEADSGSCSQ